jgi:2,4-dienoyl-CoA reductase-like NADH-dependent reductase (Old Yellow Enzyme family)
MAVSKEGSCFLNGSAYTKEQANEWRKVVDGVHKEKGLIFAQLYHSGRANKNGGIAPSAIKNRYGDSYPIPKEMTEEDINDVKSQFINANKLMKEDAGFDGVEIHAANGYIIDQFLRDATNQRNDNYGGSYENRSRFLLEIIDDSIKIWGANKVGVKLSPIGRYNDMYDSNPKELIEFLVPQLDKRRIAFVEFMVDDSIKDNLYNSQPKEQIPDMLSLVRPLLKNVPLVANCGFGTYDKANEVISQDKADFVSIGTNYISNPDLCNRFKNNYPLEVPKYQFLFTSDEEGYCDYKNYNQ